MKMTENEKTAADKILRYILNESLTGPFVYAYGIFMPIITAVFAAALIYFKAFRILMLLMAAFALWLLQYTALTRLKAKAEKAVEDLAERGQLEQAAEEFDDPHGRDIFGKDSALLTGNYIFVRGKAALLRCDDVTRIYAKEKRGRIYTAVSTNSASEIIISMADSEEDAQRCIEIIANHCPGASKGVGNENE